MSERSRASKPVAQPDHELLLRNRRAHLRDRDIYYQRAIEDLEMLVEKLSEPRESPGGLQRLREHVERLSLDFKRALYHAILAAGGDFGRTRMRGISAEEMVFTDYLKTMYSAARNTEAYLSHELMLLHFAESGEAELSPLVRQYIAQTKSYDQDIILRNVDLMVSRVAIFNKTLLQAPPGGLRSSSGSAAAASMPHAATSEPRAAEL